MKFLSLKTTARWKRITKKFNFRIKNQHPKRLSLVYLFCYQSQPKKELNQSQRFSWPLGKQAVKAVFFWLGALRSTSHSCLQLSAAESWQLEISNFQGHAVFVKTFFYLFWTFWIAYLLDYIVQLPNKLKWIFRRPLKHLSILLRFYFGFWKYEQFKVWSRNICDFARTGKPHFHYNSSR